MLPDEKLFANIDKVENRMRTALFENEPMVIFGHDDPDGITSAYILYNFKYLRISKTLLLYS